MMTYKQPIKEAPCKRACPVGIDIPLQNRLISQGKFVEALKVVQNNNTFPAVCGYVCPAFCEKACQHSHNHVGGPVAINALKRFVTEQVSIPRQSTTNKFSNKRVAVIGSGPAGLTAAYYLTQFLYKVTVLEALPEAGGMMRWGIPEYRLPRDIIDKEINEVTSVGFEINTNTTVESLDKLLAEGYDAVLVAIGAHRDTKPGIKGEDTPGVVNGANFLRDLHLGKKTHLGDKVAVIGGGYVAIDSARTALRLGAKEVIIICRRSRAEMLGGSEGAREALYEGVRIIFLAAPNTIGVKNGKLYLEYIRMKLDNSRHQQLGPIKDSNFSMDFDCIITATGQTPDVPGQFNLKLAERGTIKVNTHTLATDRPGVFACGDAVSGPSAVVKAIAAGRKAALSVDKYLGGSGEIKEAVMPHVELPAMIHGPSVGKRTAMPMLSLKNWVSSFAPVELGFDKEMAIRESTRCLWCDLSIVVDSAKCVGCFRCALMCSLRFEGAANPSNARINIVPPDRSTPPGKSQISFNENCDCCGICVRACTYGALTRSELQSHSSENLESILKER